MLRYTSYAIILTRMTWRCFIVPPMTWSRTSSPKHYRLPHIANSRVWWGFAPFPPWRAKGLTPTRMTGNSKMAPSSNIDIASLIEYSFVRNRKWWRFLLFFILHFYPIIHRKFERINAQVEFSLCVRAMSSFPFLSQPLRNTRRGFLDWVKVPHCSHKWNSNKH